MALNKLLFNECEVINHIDVKVDFVNFRVEHDICNYYIGLFHILAYELQGLTHTLHPTQKTQLVGPK